MTTDCPVCGDTFDTPTGARDHAWDAHGACHYCAEQFADREALYTHWLDAHDDLSREDRKRAETKVGDRTVCPVCDERFSGEAGVRDHAWEAHGACHHCGDALDGEDALHAHWLVVHGDDLSREDRRRARSAVGTPTAGQRLAHGGPRAVLSGADVDRRTVLRTGAVGAVAATGVAAAGTLLGGSDSGTGGSNPGGGGPGSGDDGQNPDAGQQSLSHPSAAGLASQPHLGPVPGEGPATIVAFEDPSCPSCARFETATFPTLKDRLIDGKDVSFVFRGIPVVNAWGSSATRFATLAMEAAYDRDPSAFWSLKAFYYANQRQLGRAVREETRTFLAERTDVDAEAVVADVENGVYSGAVDTDLSASRRAGVRGTPTFYLFRDGSYVTDVIGPQSTGVFEDSLGV